MKNKYKIYPLIIFVYLSISSILIANDFTFETSNIKITDNGNIIDATNGEVNSSDGKIKIIAEKFNYNKSKSILNASSNATAILLPQNIEIKANNINYNQNTSTFTATGNVNVKDLTKNILIKSQNVYLDNKNQVMESNTKTTIEDNFGNSFLTSSFFFNQKDNLIKISDSKLTDFEKNIYHLSNGFIDLSSGKIAGKDISINFNNKFFSDENEPRLKGNAISNDKNISIITKGVFTTCKKNDDCPPWQMSAKKIIHNKNKKMIYYENAWLKIYDKPVFYFPRFFHPDPTVKRQSGFLMPSFNDSTSLGSSLNIPYYHVVDSNKDFTLRPRLYNNNKILLQSEYRQKNKDSDHLIDFSIMNNKNPNQNHFFANSSTGINLQNFDETEMKLQIQRVSDDTYLKTYKIESPIIKSTDSLTSSLEFDAYREDLTINTSFQIFEKLNVRNNDRYEFVYPSYQLTKQLDQNFDIDGSLSLNSTGYIKNYNTNIYEKVIVNDLLLKTDHKISDAGFKSNFDYLIKNINTDATKSEKYKDEISNTLASMIKYNLSYPLIKQTKNYINKFKPLMAIRFSPNKSKNVRDNDTRLDISNVYGLNRISSIENVEEGTSLTYGFEYIKTNNSNKDIFQINLANILRAEESKNLPNQSGLGNKTSDFIGNLEYSPNDILKINYDFSLDSNIEDINYQLIETEFKVNNIVTSFEYLNENKTKNNASYITNKTSYYIDKTKNFTFEARENKKTGLTEFYNLIYQYRNDCLIAAIEYNKEYYNDGELQPEENVFFKFTIIPFGETSTTNLLK